MGYCASISTGPYESLSDSAIIFLPEERRESANHQHSAEENPNLQTVLLRSEMSYQCGDKDGLPELLMDPSPPLSTAPGLSKPEGNTTN